MHGAVRDITRSACRECNSEAEKHQKTQHDTSVILDIVGPAFANAMPPWVVWTLLFTFVGATSPQCCGLWCAGTAFSLGTTSRRLRRPGLTHDAASNGAAFGWRCWLTQRTTSKRSCQRSPRIRIMVVVTSRQRFTRLPWTSRSTSLEKMWRHWDDADSSMFESKHTGEIICRSNTDLNQRIVAPS